MRTALLLACLLDVALPFALTARPHFATARCHVRCTADDELWETSYMAELRSRITDCLTSSPQLGPAEEVLRNSKMQRVWVLLFNFGRENEGVYTLQAANENVNGPESFVLAFEQDDEASRFAEQLQASGFDLPQPTQWGATQVCDFCQMAEFQLGIVPTGALLTPPTTNEFDRDAFEALRNEGGAVEEEESAELKAIRQKLDRIFRDESFDA